MQVISNWFRRYFSDPQVVILAVLLIVGFAIVIFFGRLLAPVLAAVIIAYLLEGVVSGITRWGVPRGFGVATVFAVFMAFLLFVFFWVLPTLSQQVAQLVQMLPAMVAQGQDALLRLPEMYPDHFSEEQVREFISVIRSEVAAMGQRALSLSVASLMGLIMVLVYLVLVPLMVFFFLKDKDRIIGWIAGYMPKDLGLVSQVWHDVDRQIGNYIRGKFWEILIVWGVTYVTFTLLGLQFAMLLGLFVGLSVLIPYIGAAVMTVPVALIAYFQWGLTWEMAYVLIAYGIIQLLDGNLLAPLLFSEVVDLHPVAIITAILVFGGLWGFWGLFFAIPLATLVQAVLKAWPRTPQPVQASGEAGPEPEETATPATHRQASGK